MTNNNIKPNGGMGGLLTMLASKGDRGVQLLIVAGLIWNQVSTHNNGKGIQETNKELDQLRGQVSRQVRVIYENQRPMADYMDEMRAAMDRIQAKAGIPHPAITPYPRLELPEHY